MSETSANWDSLKRILGYIAIGFVLLCLLVSVDSPLLRKFENYGIDWLLRMHVGTASTQNGADFVFLDIDETSYRMWDEPWFTPRDKLLQLIRFAESGGARILIVDIDLSRHLEGEDGAVYRHFERYTEGEADLPQLLLSASMRYPALPEDPERPLRRESPLDPIVARSPQLHWASPIFVKDVDQVIRRWQLLARIDGDDKPLPSHQLLSAALLRDEKQLDAWLTQLGREPEGSVRIGEMQLDLSDNNLPQRIHYAVQWGADDPTQTRGIRATSGLTIVPAHRITDSDQEFDATTVAGKIVIIGASHRESGDMHRTPLGMMPGSVIIVNAIHSLLSAGQVHPPPWWARLLIGLVPLVVMSVALEKMKLLILNKVLVWVMILVMVPTSFVLFHHGVWMDFFLPMILVDLVAKLRRAREIKVLALRGVSSVVKKAKR